MMSGDGACLCIFGVVVADNETIHRVGVLLRGDFLGKGVDNAFNGRKGRLLYEAALYRLEALSVEPRHALAPAVDVCVRIYQGEGNPLDVAVFDVLRVFDGQRA